MEENENKIPNEEKLYTEKEFMEYKAALDEEFQKKYEQMKSEFEKQSQRAEMTELEIALSELEDLKIKYREKENECLMTKQKEEAALILDKAGLDRSILNVVYTPLDLKETKEKIETLKTYIEKIKKGVFQNYAQTPLPLTSNTNEYDAFTEGFETNTL